MMNPISAIREAFNLEVDEPFLLDGIQCWFSETEFHVEKSPCKDLKQHMLYKLVTGETYPERRRTIPKIGKNYFYYETMQDAGSHIVSTDWQGNDDDLARYLCGNCFHTEEEAERYPNTINDLNTAALRKDRQEKERFS